MLSRLLRLLGRLGYLLLLAIAFVVSAYLSFNLFVRRGVTPVPELVNASAEEARAVLADQGLGAREAPEGRYDAKREAGRVVEQRPRAGSLVKRGSVVELVVSLGPQLARVPDLRGQAVGAAQVTLAAEGLRLGRTLGVMSSTAGPGIVAGQSPGPDERTSRGAEIDVLVGQETSLDSYVMPDLVHRDLSLVRRAFEQRGLRFGSVTSEPYEGLPPGIVLRQMPLAGHRLARREPISVVVSGATGGG